MASWSVSPSEIREEEVSFKTTNVTFRSGLEVRYGLQSLPRRKFLCFFNVADEPTIKAHFVSQKGSLLSFDFIHPETNEVIRVRYENDSLPRKKLTGEMYEIEVSILEVFYES